MKLSELKQLAKNPNKGSERGNALLETSFEKGGVGRSILIANNGEILAGNHAMEVYGQLFDEQEVIVIETDGKQLVAVKRTDIPDSEDKRAKALIIGDNRTSDFHEYDSDVLLGLLQNDKDVLNTFFYEFELDKIIHQIEDTSVDYAQEWQDMPEFEQKKKELYHSVTVHFRTQQDLEDFSALIEQDINQDTSAIYFPKTQRQNLKNLRIVDES